MNFNKKAKEKSSKKVNKSRLAEVALMITHYKTIIYC